MKALQRYSDWEAIGLLEEFLRLPQISLYAIL
jgi:hypothetical protein